MNCRKCGALRITRRCAGVFVCRRCGVQPGPLRLDRFGNMPPATQQVAPADDATPVPYEFAARQPRLPTIFSTKEK